ncbi:Asp23/Gls24 family envelope stress response protein [uncultured Corynebacterium sp.]|uniref:Asp23/Gls24 family envelope stress response protein n=1 Tax=uncultured Corynebacterium sp. TaxID=159447 RepID=UPI0025E74BF3|nr:Asp23/Gls24 family envelope stress response protein [uncultured Corynebacterium sp.]
MEDTPQTTDAPEAPTVLTGPGNPGSPDNPVGVARTGAQIRIDDRVPRTFAVRGALSVPGVISHSSGIGRFTGRSLPRADLRWDADHHSVSVDLQIAVAWPSPVITVATVVRETVAAWITAATGIPVSVVNVTVAAVVPDTRVTTTVVETAPRSPELAPVVATPLTVVSPTVTRSAGAPVHPRTHRRTTLTPVRAGRPLRPEHVTAPPVPATVPVRTAPRTSLAEISVRHRPVTEPPQPTPPFVLHDIPTPAGPVLENIPTPQGLPVRTVPTPDGLPLTVFPRVDRHDRVPVTVHRGPRITPTVVRGGARPGQGKDRAHG